MFSLLGEIDWNDSAPCFKKAYVCSIFSQWAYAVIPEWEMKEAKMKRVKLFNASSLYNYLVSVEGQPPFDFEAFLQDQREVVNPVLTITDNRLMVAVVLRRQNVIFISLRGTIYLPDFFVDAYGIKEYPLKAHFHCGFHRGFYLAVARSFRKLRDEIFRLSSNPLIYVTGHSLGGAMSGILHGLWNVDAVENAGQYGRVNYPQVRSAYTFGMPRFGDENAMELLRNYPLYYPSVGRAFHPYHILHPLDNIPGVPPRSLNYADSDFEWLSTTGKRIASRKERDKSFLNRVLEAASGWSNHDIDKYVEKTRRLAVKP
jgi:hypothetical protein